MASVDFEDVKQDRLAMSVARALSLANVAALAEGTDPTESLVTITQENSAASPAWRIHYGPRDYVNRRGGDLMVVVDADSDTVHRVIRGQ